LINWMADHGVSAVAHGPYLYVSLQSEGIDDSEQLGGVDRDIREQLLGRIVRIPVDRITFDQCRNVVERAQALSFAAPARQSSGSILSLGNVGSA
jgi:hypothetical protein